MFSAYTIRKVLPRLLIAVIAIQLSWSIVLLAVHINNEVAHGLQALFYAPFGGTDTFDLGAILQTNGGNATGAAATGVFLTAAAGGGFFVLGPGTLVGVLALAGTAALGILIAIFTLVLRRAVLLFLIVIAPLAIVAWVLPGTEKFWKLWWESFSKLLLMYPLILLLVAAGRVFAKVAAASDAQPLMTYAMVVLGFFGPLFMIPATLKLAGTAFSTLTSAVNNKGKGAFDRLRGVRENQAKKNSAYHLGKMQNRSIAKRADLQNRWQTAAAGKSGLSKFALAAASRKIGGRNIQAEAAAMQAKSNKELADQTNSGRDEEWRGLTVNKRSAMAAGALGAADADGNRSNGLMRVTASGERQFKTLGGAWVSEQAVDDGQKRWGKDRYAQQAALSYEMRKASTDDEVEGIVQRYGALATGAGGWGMNTNQANGALIGAGFENQNQHLEFKNTTLDANNSTAALTLNGKKLATEAYEKKGSYPLSQMSAHTFKQLGAAHAEAKRNGDTETMRKVESVAETFMSRFGGSSGVQLDASGSPIAAAPTGAGGVAGAPQYQTNAPGAGHVAEAARQLAVDVGVYRPLDPSTETHSAQGPSNGPRQN
jgi:hypothetical protein